MKIIQFADNWSHGVGNWEMAHFWDRLGGWMLSGFWVGSWLSWGIGRRHSNGSLTRVSRVLKVWSESCSVMSDSLLLHGLYSPWNSPGQNTGVGSLSFLQGIFPIQRSNPGLPHCRWILYQLSHMGSPRVLEWVAYSFSSRSSWPRNRTGVSCIAGGFFTNWAIREAPKEIKEETKKYLLY